MIEYVRLDGESDEELILRICQDRDNGLIGSWQEVANILNKLLNTEYTESKFRKQYQSFRKMLEANSDKFANGDKAADNINEQIRALQRERIKLRDEKNEYNRWLRENSRAENITEQICDAISKLDPLPMPTLSINSQSNSRKSYLLCLSDAHYGVEFDIKDLFGHSINKYSPDIFNERMGNLFSEVAEIIRRENIMQLNVWELGDGIQGILRLNSQLQKLKYGIIESSVLYADYLANWLNWLSEYVYINFQMVMDSNHNQLRICGAPKNAFVDENMSYVMMALIKERLKGNKRINIHENPTGMNYSMIGPYSVLGCHGEAKDLTKYVDNFARAYNTPIDYMVCGHVHHTSKDEIGINSEILTVGSIMGTDPYGISLSKVSDASCSMFVFDELHGKCCEYTIKLN